MQESWDLNLPPAPSCEAKTSRRGKERKEEILDHVSMHFLNISQEKGQEPPWCKRLWAQEFLLFPLGEVRPRRCLCPFTA